MSAKPYPLRIPDNLMELVEAKAREDHTDRATALRQLLYAGTEDHVMVLLSEGRVSISRAAELLDMSPHKINTLARKRGMETGATLGDYQQGRKVARDLL